MGLETWNWQTAGPQGLKMLKTMATESLNYCDISMTCENTLCEFKAHLPKFSLVQIQL